MYVNYYMVTKKYNIKTTLYVACDVCYCLFLELASCV
jgi:hypothetical protein